MQRGAGREAPYANENGDLTREIRRENWVAAWRRARSLPRRGKVKGRMIKQAVGSTKVLKDSRHGVGAAPLTPGTRWLSGSRRWGVEATRESK